MRKLLPYLLICSLNLLGLTAQKAIETDAQNVETYVLSLQDKDLQPESILTDVASDINRRVPFKDREPLINMINKKLNDSSSNNVKSRFFVTEDGHVDVSVAPGEGSGFVESLTSALRRIVNYFRGKSNTDTIKGTYSEPKGGGLGNLANPPDGDEGLAGFEGQTSQIETFLSKLKVYKQQNSKIGDKYRIPVEDLNRLAYEAGFPPNYFDSNNFMDLRDYVDNSNMFTDTLSDVVPD